MSVINCYHIMDIICLCELVSVSDTRGLNVEYFQKSRALSEQQLITHSEYFVYIILSCDNFDWCEWLSKASSHFK